MGRSLIFNIKVASVYKWVDQESSLYGIKNTTSHRKSFRFFLLFLFSLFASIQSLWSQTTTDTIFYATGTWTAPQGITIITVEAWGGGGGGGSIAGGNTTGATRGGGGGAYSRKLISGIIPGNQYNVVIGAGGSTDSDGGSSIFGSGPLVQAAGGKKGNSDTNGAGGLGGTVAESIGDIIYRGGNAVEGGGGGAGSNGQGGDAFGTTGGTGASVNGGNGGNAPTSGRNPGNPGFNYGGGGSGAIKTSNGGTQNGGSGANGLVKITYCMAPVITSQPASQIVTYDANATFTVETNATNISSYQWQVNNGSGWTNTGTNSATLIVSKPGVNMTGYQYRCIITNDCGSYSISSAATLTVNPRILTVTAGNQSVTYGTHDGNITENGTYTISGFTNGDNSSVLNGLNTISYTTNYTENTNAGTSGIYITPDVTGLSAVNYTFTAANGTITIIKANQFISCDCVPFTKPLNEFDTIRIGASSSSGLPVTITMLAGSAAVLHGSPGNYYLTDIGSTGSVTLYANQSGDVNYNPAAQGTRFFDVTKSNQNISFPAISDQTYYTGLALNLEAVASSGLAVSYIVESGNATISGNILTITGTGDISVRAVQPGDASYNAAASVVHSFTVNKGPQTITISIPSGTITESSQITASSTSGLPVMLTLGTGSAATGLFNHGSYYTLTGLGSSGYIEIVGNQAGDDNFLQADQESQIIDISKSNQTITFNPLANQTYYPSLTVSLSATASSGLTVSYTLKNGTAILSGDALTVTGVGTIVVEASQAGNSTYNPAPTVTRQFEVLKATPVIVQNNITKSFNDPPFTVSPTSESSGSFSFISGNDEIFTISGNVATITGAGTASLDITQQPTANYNGATKTVSVTISRNVSTITVTGPTSYTYNSTHQGPNTSTVVGSTGAVTYSYSGTGTTVYGPNSMQPVNAGTYEVIASVEADDNYAAASSNPYAFTIAKADPVISVTPYAVTYDGTLHIAVGTAEGVALENLSGLDLAGTAHTDAGNYTSDSWTFTDVTGNYNNASGTINDNISTKALSVTAQNQLKCYGEDFVFTGTEFTPIGLVGTETIGSVNITSAGAVSTAVAGDYSINPSNATGGTFNPGNYTITYNNGTFKVNPLPTLTGASQGSINCEGSATTINLSGLLTEKIFSLDYSINGTPQPQVTGLYSDLSGNSSFTTPVLIKENNNQVLQITDITITSEVKNCSGTFSLDVVLKVTPLPTLSGASQVVTVCEGSGAEITLTGLVASSSFTVYYEIDGVDQTPIEGLSADGSGNSVFTTQALSASNNGQILQITGLEITDNSSGCYQGFTQNVTLSVEPISEGGTASANDPSICENENTVLTLYGYTGTIQWQQSDDGITGWNDVSAGSGGNTESYTTPILTSTVFYRAVVTNGVCNAENSNVVEVIVNPLPEIGSFN